MENLENGLKEKAIPQIKNLTGDIEKLMSLLNLYNSNPKEAIRIIKEQRG